MLYIAFNAAYLLLTIVHLLFCRTAIFPKVLKFPCWCSPIQKANISRGLQGGSRGRVQGVCTPPWDDLRLSNTTAILKNKCGLFVLVTPFLSGAPPPKKNSGSVPDLWVCNFTPLWISSLSCFNLPVRWQWGDPKFLRKIQLNAHATLKPVITNILPHQLNSMKTIFSGKSSLTGRFNKVLLYFT